ncbi:hypothetical protein, partial [Actinomadura sp. KC345]|uniref:hypothetical protein n=1 Tax=Actinomadura sp. KC345 TaxID=2530371 RepID=UPI001A9E2660
MAYLLQVAGLDLGYHFERAHYGPFSADLNRDISAMEGHYLLGYGNGTGGARADLRLIRRPTKRTASSPARTPATNYSWTWSDVPFAVGHWRGVG